jgi:hypothetical protein
MKGVYPLVYWENNLDGYFNPLSLTVVFFGCMLARKKLKKKCLRFSGKTM